MTKPSRKAKEQQERFKAKARELGADESGEAFERAIKKIARPRRKTATRKVESDQ